jgi:electron transport complex protein RnfG
VTTDGFGGKLQILVGVSTKGTVTGVVVLEESEPLGLGASAQDFLAQFVGRSGTITVGRGRNAVDAVSGATTTSEAVAEGVSTALSVVAHLDLEGGGNGDEEGEV